MLFANATNFNRKSGVAQWRDLRFSFTSHPNSKALMSSYYSVPRMPEPSSIGFFVRHA